MSKDEDPCKLGYEIVNKTEPGEREPHGGRGQGMKRITPPEGVELKKGETLYEDRGGRHYVVDARGTYRRLKPKKKK